VAAWWLTPPQKIPSAKNLLENFSPRFFGIKTAGSNYPGGVLLISAGANERRLERKMPRGHQRGLLLYDNAQANPALATQKKLAYLGFQCLDHPPYTPDLAPSDYHLFPGLKKQLKGRHFSSEAEVIAAKENWLDGQPSEFFSEWLAKIRATG